MFIIDAYFVYAMYFPQLLLWSSNVCQGKRKGMGLVVHLYNSVLFCIFSTREYFSGVNIVNEKQTTMKELVPLEKDHSGHIEGMCSSTYSFIILLYTLCTLEFLWN